MILKMTKKNNFMKKAIGVLINDIHLDKNNGDLVKDIFKQIINVCEKYKTRRIFCGGDVFTNRSGQPLQCLTDWKEILQKLTKQNIELHVIPGNHDKTDSNSEKSYLDIFGERCVHLYRSHSRILYNNCLLCFIPYFQDEKWLEEFQELEEEINDDIKSGEIDKEVVRILITHMGFDGVINNDGSVVESQIKPSLFKNWTKVLIGHYHNASNLSKNVIYTGSAYQNNYGENITDKGFTVIYEDGSLEHINSHFPKYIKEIIDANDKETLMNLLEKYDSEKYNHIRFIFVGKKVDCQKINIADIQGRYGIDCKFQCNEEKEAIELSEDDAVLEYDKKSLIKDFMKFCSENNIKGEKFKYGINLMKKVDYVESN